MIEGVVEAAVPVAVRAAIAIVAAVAPRAPKAEADANAGAVAKRAVEGAIKRVADAIRRKAARPNAPAASVAQVGVRRIGHVVGHPGSVTGYALHVGVRVVVVLVRTILVA